MGSHPTDQLRQKSLRVVPDHPPRLPAGPASDVTQITPQLGLPLHQVNRETLVSQRQGSRHPRHSPPDDQHRFLDRDLGLVKRFLTHSVRHGHTHQIHGLLRRCVPLIRMHPRALIPNISHREHAGVQPGLADRVLKQ